MVKDIIFFSLLFLLALACAYIVVTKSGPVVLGSELNTNGRVEYLCLGAGCDRLD